VLIAHGFPHNDPGDPEEAASEVNGEHDGLVVPNINSQIRRWGWSLVAELVVLILLVLLAVPYRGPAR
jgi:hypothetical protein